MKGHVRRRGSGWAFVTDVEGQRAQRCESCARWAWLERERAMSACPSCGGPLRAPQPRRRQVWKSGFATKKAAEAALRTFMSAVETGADPYPADLTLRDYAARWLASERVTSLRPRTARRYGQVFEDHLLPVLGSLQLAQLRPRHVRAALDTVGAKGLEPRSVVECRAVLSTALAAAVQDEVIDANPVAAVKAPTARRRTLSVPTAPQLTALIGAARGTPWELPMLLAATTGMRRSEVLALTWRHVDLDAGRVQVVASLHRVNDDAGTRLVFFDPKTDRSRRTVALPAVTVERLRRWRREQTERRLRLGAAWNDHDLVCDRGDGGPFDPDSFSTAFKRLADALGLPPTTRLHDVRHAVATTMLEHGVHPAIASAVLGHSNVAFTMSVYQHVLDGMTDRAAEAIGVALAVAP